MLGSVAIDLNNFITLWIKNQCFFLVEAQGNTEIELEHIYEAVDPVYENVDEKVLPCLEINFLFIQEHLNKLLSCETLRVRRCPSMLSAVNLMPLIVEKFFKSFSSAKCVEFYVDSLAIDALNEFYYIKFVEKFKGFQWSFMVTFESSQDGSFCAYWRQENTKHVFSLHVPDNDVGLCCFIKNFLMKTLKNGKNGNFLII